MLTSGPGSLKSRAGPAKVSAGFTLIELLVVVAIVALASAGVGLAMRDGGQVQLAREAERLAALLESGRASSRASGLPLQWRATPEGFQFEARNALVGANNPSPAPDLPRQWLDADTTVAPQVGDVGNARNGGWPVLVLGPDPIIGPQVVELVSRSQPERRVRLSTDGVRPFAVQPGPL